MVAVFRILGCFSKHHLDSQVFHCRDGRSTTRGGRIFGASTTTLGADEVGGKYSCALRIKLQDGHKNQLEVGAYIFIYREL